MHQLFTKMAATSTRLRRYCRSRCDIVMSSRAVNELLPKYANYCRNQLLTVSAEDCADMVTAEIVGQYDAWQKVNDSTSDNSKGRVFFAKAIVILARCRHSRDADELNILMADRMPDELFEAAVRECEAVAADGRHFLIPDYVYDVHTRRGRRRGKTKAHFMPEEHDALVDPVTMFANFDTMAASDSYVQPELDLQTIVGAGWPRW